MTGLAILLSLVFGILSLLFYLRPKLRYFQRLGVLHVKPWPFLGNMAEHVFRRASVADLMQRTYNINQDAKYVGFYEFMTPLMMIRDPELIKSITVRNFDSFVNHRGFGADEIEPLFNTSLFNLRDDKWRTMRNLLSPAFTSSKMKEMFKLMADYGKDFGSFMADTATDGQVVNMKEVFTRVTNDIIATCGFGMAVDSLREPENEFYVRAKNGIDLTKFSISLKFFVRRNFPNLSKFLGIKFFDDSLKNFFENLVATMIKKRDAEGIYRPDMIQLMMESRGKGHEDLTISEMTAQAFIFFLGGFDTTSTLMTNTSYLIAAHPEVQEKLHREVDEVLARNNGELTYEALNSMVYLDAVVNESTRVFPTPPFLDRVCSREFELPPALPGAKPVTLQPGTSVWFPVYPLHRDPRYFSDPERFLPERFIDRKREINPYVFTPFGVGPRMCIGNRFALMEVKIILAHLLARCKLVPTSKTVFPTKLSNSSINVVPEGGCWLRFKARG